MQDVNPRSGPRAVKRGGWTALAVKGEAKLAARLPAAAVQTVGGAILVAFLPPALANLGVLKLIDAALVCIVLFLPLLIQLPMALALRRQKAALLTFLARCGSETEILSSKAFCLDSFDIQVKTVAAGQEHRFRYGYAPLTLRGPPYVYMIWPTTRKGISFQNATRFNNFSKKFNTMEFSYVRNWTVRLFAYPTKGDLWWFDLYLFRGAKATPDHLWECYQIALETKDKLTRPNPAF